MFTSTRKRHPGPSDQASQTKRRAQYRPRACCSCYKQLDVLSFFSPYCSRCGHTLCESCPADMHTYGISHPNASENVREDPLTSSLLLHPKSVQQQCQDKSGEDKEEHLVMKIPDIRITQEDGMGLNIEGSRAQKLQPQPTKRQNEAEMEESRKRSLNMNKCERCRSDKKKVR